MATATPGRSGARPVRAGEWAGPGGAVLRRASRAIAALRVSPWAIAIAALLTLSLLVLAGAYGWHRDELYFVVAGRHPAFGYPDQPPLTPLLAAASVALLGPSPVSVRILPALVTGIAILLTADMARRFGGAARAQVVAALTLTASGFLFAGHLASTATFDLAIWTVVVWLIVKVLTGGDPRLWLGIGAALGLGFENKHLVVLFVAGLGAGFVLARRWDVVRSAYAWAGAVVAALIALPNIAWQMSNGWPALDMAAAIARSAALDRAKFVLELWLLAGSLVAFIPAIGLVWLLARSEARTWRPIGWAAIVTLGLVVVSQGKSYYAIGVIPALVAAGSVVVERWLARGRTPLRPAVLGFVTTASIGLMAVLTLPIVPVTSLASTPIPEINAEQGAQIGWPELVDSVRAAAASLPAENRTSTVILTSNYGEAAAVELLAPDLAPVYSGHNGYWDWGPPPDGRSAAILVGPGSFDAFGVAGCRVAGVLRNDAGVENQEWGYEVRVCHSVPASFADGWRLYRHLD